MQTDLINIKKYYGEEMMHFCKINFPSILEKEGHLFSLISSKFAYSKYLYDDIINEHKEEEFRTFIYGLLNYNMNIMECDADPFTLMKKAGYTLYECKTSNDLDCFKKYYQNNELLCTFRNNNRLLSHYVFFAVKDNADKLNRDDFSNPLREDEYGRSVISIQFTKGKVNILSIKNRYNHTVTNPDATYNNNLDNIIVGLTDSFSQKYHLNIFYNKENFEMNNYVLANDGKYYKYNYEINNVYYCTNNIIIDKSEVIKFPKEKYLIIDYFIVDLINKKISLYDKKINDAFINNEIINKIEIHKLSNCKEIVISYINNEMVLGINQNNQIISYKSNFKTIGNNFLYYNSTLTEFVNNSVLKIGNNFLLNNHPLNSIKLLGAVEIGNNFLSRNSNIGLGYFPNLEKVGDLFLRSSSIEKISFPKLKECGFCFMQLSNKLREIDLPSLLRTGSFFISSNKILEKITADKLKYAAQYFLSNNQKLKKVDFPSILAISDYFLIDNKEIEIINLPNVIKIGNSFMTNNQQIKKISLPKAEVIGNDFFKNNDSITDVYVPTVLKIGDNFMFSNTKLKKVSMERIISIGNYFLANDEIITEAIFPSLKECGQAFLYLAANIIAYDFSSLNNIKAGFLLSFLHHNDQTPLIIDLNIKDDINKVLKKKFLR